MRVASRSLKLCFFALVLVLLSQGLASQVSASPNVLSPVGTTEVTVDGTIDAGEYRDAASIKFPSALVEGEDVVIKIKYDYYEEELIIAATLPEVEGLDCDGFYIAFDTLNDGGEYVHPDDFMLGVFRKPCYGYDVLLLQSDGPEFNLSTPDPGSLPSPFGAYRFARRVDSGVWSVEVALKLPRTRDYIFRFFTYQRDVVSGEPYYYRSFYPTDIEDYEAPPDDWAVLAVKTDLMEMRFPDKSPESGDTVGDWVTLEVEITDMEGDPIEGALARFFLDDVLVGEAYSEDDGDAWVEVNPSEGEHEWRLSASMYGYKDKTSAYRSFTKKTFFDLTLNSKYGSTFGASTYKTGATARFSVTPTEISVSPRERLVFDGWTSSDKGGYNGDSPEASVKINRDITETAQWKTQYYVEIVPSEGGRVDKSSRWVDEGAEITLAAVPDENYVYDAWNGVAGVNSVEEVTVQVNSPLTVSAVFKPILCTLDVESSYGTVQGEGQYIKGSEVTIAVDPVINYGAPGTRYVFDGWQCNGGGYTGELCSVNVILRDDLVQEAVWKTQYYVSIDSEMTVDGEGWYDEGQQITLRAEGSSGLLVRKIFDKWEGDVESDKISLALLVDEPKSLTAVYTLGYARLIIAAVATLGTGISATVLNNSNRRLRKLDETKSEIILAVKTEQVIRYDELSRRYGVSRKLVKKTVQDYVKENPFDAYSFKNGSGFIKKYELQRILRDKLR